MRNIEAMRKRQSIRTYEPDNIAEIDLQKINEYTNDEANFLSPFGRNGKLQYIPVTNNVSEKGIKLGTYGFIKNHQGYLVGISENNRSSLVEFGYVFEKLILLLTKMGIGTCWMGGTFSRKSFAEEIGMIEGEFIPCVTPIGYPKEKQRIFDKVLRYAVKADNKKPWDKLFYYGGFETSLTKIEARELETPIEMVRIGPSASNKQPWRLVLSEDKLTCHFYIEHTPNYSTKLGYMMQYLDMGIAMCHFDLACEELKLAGNWIVDNPKYSLPNEHVEYLFSWKKEK